MLYSGQSFLFKLSDDAARTLPPSCEEPISSIDVPKLTIAVFPRHVAEDMAAHVSLPLNDLKLTVSVNVASVADHVLCTAQGVYLSIINLWHPLI